ncbi:FCD domain-containing protein [Shinella sp. 838]|uniref:FCD domain-containing protein n=1 Tax=Rhizobiaceae TaxID=82115 RepID=UPI001E56114D|nr:MULTISPECIES: FCD domain-containing protein [Rhizobiaceae]MCC8934102.1 FCD domain-containing protein [Rhizobium sp. 'Codium 1']MDG4674857.1 FCD domain-containing protein [Shinella sp. 838]
MRNQTAEDSRQGGRAADWVIANIQEDILSGALENGAPLPAERELMERFGTSRTVVREAITTLSSRGMIEARPRYRPVVRKPGYDTALSTVGSIVKLLIGEPSGVRTLYESRVFMERALSRDAARLATRDDINDLRTALAANHDAIDNSVRFYNTDVAFHGVLYRIPRNPIFPAVHEAYTSWLAPHWERMPRSPERNRMNYLSHKAIFDAIVDRDGDAAEKALETHLSAAWEYVRGTFEVQD